MVKRLFLLSLYLFFYGALVGQISTVQQQLVWVGANIEFAISKQWALGVHAEERRFMFPDARQQRVVSDFYVYRKLNDKWDINAGLWLFEIAVPQNPFAPLQGQVKETRPYLAISRYWTLPKAKLKFRLQSEYRYFRDLNAPSFFEGPAQSQRIRERFLLEYKRDISAKGKLVFYDELHLTVASTNERGLFQQNRLGWAYQHAWTKSFSTTLGYLFWFQPTGLPDEYFARQIVNVKFKYRFSFKK